MKVSIYHLPAELFLTIFKFLPPKDLGRLATVSKKIKTLAEDDQLWKPLSTQDYPDSSLEFYQLFKRTRSSSWKDFYQRRTHFFSHAAKNNLKKIQLIQDCSISCLALFQGTLFAGSEEKKIFKYKEGNGVSTAENCHEEKITCIKVEKNKEGQILLYTGSVDGVIKIWDDTFQLKTELKGHTQRIFGIEANENHFFSASQDRSIQIWDKGTCAQIKTIDEFDSEFLSIAYGADKLIAGTNEGSIGVWDGKTHEFLKEIKAGGIVYQIKILENTIYCSNRQNITIWDLTSYELIKKVHEFTNGRPFDIFDGRLFCCADSILHLDIEIYNARTFERESVKPIPTSAIAIDAIRVSAEGIFYGNSGFGQVGLHSLQTANPLDMNNLQLN